MSLEVASSKWHSMRHEVNKSKRIFVLRSGIPRKTLTGTVNQARIDAATAQQFGSYDIDYCAA